ncbi:MULTISPECIES: ABC transporter permease [Caloramator]|uniref:Sodium transport system permease protein n=1 Tax=Caloramator proteoclasticus DSM 10124 TaxID=1121262 RepID=A0A1M4W4A7_9CLOT|nr:MULTISPECIES: ABC transporter permease [Caloramator]SHE76056.1 sodium transport system permease protein [Caloramator proteoclasticus DSM 10124]
MNSLWGIVFKKELKDLFRDRKTVIMSVLLPLVLFPLLFGLIGKGVKSTTEKVAKEVKIAYIGEESSFKNFLSSVPNIKIVETKDYQEEVKKGTIYLAVVVEEDFDEKLSQEKMSDIKIIYDSESTNSQTALDVVKDVINTYKDEVVKGRLEKRGIDVSILSPVDVKNEPVNREKAGGGALMLTMLLPLYLIIYAITGPMAAAVDLGAGEKERGTLEPLLTTQASRMQLLFGKLFAITVMGIIGTTSSLTGLYIAFKYSMDFMGDVGLKISIGSLVLIGVTAIILNMIFAAVELAVSIYARSFKEAQTYLSPVTIIGMIVAYGTYMMDVKSASTMMFNIPLANISLIIKEFIIGVYNPMHIVITFVWAIVYIIAAILFARYMFSREEVVFRT